ncbi:MaoC family dehydratase [Aestuariivita boseongensis]|uniref:MaoC family dehydratase n=1 Tax=Aestuariivita boseongensis TaxID=1470562 RepID=UPI0006818026|nr:MaoC family dehydratase [Aestuariivita boseongensis]
MYFDDMPVGFTFETGSRTLSAEAIKRFAREWDPQPFHLDEDAAAASVYGGLIASGFHTVLTAFTLTLEASDWSDSSMGSPGMENVRWIKPVYAGDTLRVKAEVTAATPSRSKPDRGFVEVQYDILNQDDVLVAAYRASHMLRRRQAE